MLKRWLNLILVAALAAACAKNPVTGRDEFQWVSEQQEIQLGTRNYLPGQQDSGGRYLLEPALEAYVGEIGQRLAAVSDRPKLPFQFVVLNDSVPNAWAMPGGKIALNRGLLLELKSEAELAAVLAHEIVHATARHGARSMESGLLLQAGAVAAGVATADRRGGEVIGKLAGIGAGLVGMKYGRDHELEADHYGMRYMVRAGYDPAAAVRLQETFVRLAGERRSNWLEGLFSSHPPSQERVDANRRLAATLPQGLKVGSAEYRQKVAPLEKARPAYAALDEGRQALAKSDAAKALEAADKAIRIEPREAHFHGLRGDALLKLGKREAAETAYDEAVRLNPDYYPLRLKRGELRYRAGDRRAASADFEHANRLRPTDVAYYHLGMIARDLGEQPKAVEYLRKASGESEIGQRAGTALIEIDLPQNPGRYLETERLQEPDGRLVLRVKNPTPLTVRQIEVEARIMDGYRIRQRAHYRLPRSLGPRESHTFATDWNLRQLGARPEMVEAGVMRAVIEQ